MPPVQPPPGGTEARKPSGERSVRGDPLVRRLLALLGIFLFIVLIVLGGENAVRALLAASPKYVILSFLTTAWLTAVSARRWGNLTELAHGGSQLSFRKYYHSFILSRVAGLVVPVSLGDLGVRPLVHRATTRSSGLTALYGVVAERIFDAWVLLISGVAACLYLLDRIDSDLFLLLMAVLHSIWLILFLSFTSTVTRVGVSILSQLSRLFRARLGGLSTWIAEAARALSSLESHRQVLCWVAAQSILRFGLIVTQLVLIGRALATPGIGTIEVLAAVPAGHASMLVAVTPGGLGFFEGGLGAALLALQVEPSSVTSFLLGQRILTTAYLVTLAMLSWIVSLVGSK